MGATQSKVTGGRPAQRRFNPATGRYDLYDLNMGRFVTQTSQQNIFAKTQAAQQMNQQRQAAVAAQQKAEKRVAELEKELKGFRDIAEGKGDVGFRTPTRTVSTVGSVGADLRIGDRSGSQSRRTIRARSRGVSQLSTG